MYVDPFVAGFVAGAVIMLCVLVVIAVAYGRRRD